MTHWTQALRAFPDAPLDPPEQTGPWALDCACCARRFEEEDEDVATRDEKEHLCADCRELPAHLRDRCEECGEPLCMPSNDDDPCSECLDLRVTSAEEGER